VSEPEHYWEYCLAVYSWTGATQDVDILNSTWYRTNALPSVTVTNSTDGTTVMINIPLTVIGNPSTVTLGVVTSEDDSKIKDTVGSGTAITVGSQWVQIEPARDGSSSLIDLPMDGSVRTVSDPTPKDFCGKAFWDMTNVVVNLDYANIIVDVTFLNISGLSAFWDQWWISIQIDTDQVLGSGEPFLFNIPGTGGLAARFVNESVSEWELCAIVNSPTDITLYNVTGTYPSEAASLVTSPHGITATLIEAKNKVRVAIPRSWLKVHTWTDYNLTVTVVSGTDAGGKGYDISGTYGYVYNLPWATAQQGTYIGYTNPSLNETGPYKAIISMSGGNLNITTVNINLDQWFSGPDASLVVRWLTYLPTYKQQTNKTIWTGNLPVRNITLQDITNPLSVGDFSMPVEVFEVVLISGGEQIIVARFVVSRAILNQRLGKLDVLWSVPGVSRSLLMKEYVAIDGQWPYAPPT